MRTVDIKNEGTDVSVSSFFYNDYETSSFLTFGLAEVSL